MRWRPRRAPRSRSNIIDYKQGDVQLSGLLVYDDAQSGKRPGVLLARDRAGMAENAFRDSELIAKMGYVVFVEDMFGKGYRAQGRARDDRHHHHLQQ